ncbi:hypothetical protein HD554DRAFT_2310612 [Boletus coccyginus]|nr:hypothetical protein HD554DRAFT_2310612 [Boletus coccyginus]
MSFNVRRRSKNESSENSSSSSVVHRKEATPIVIDGRDKIYSVAVPADGKYLVSGGDEGKIRRWRIEDGKEVGTAIDGRILNIAISRDGKFIVGAMQSGWVTVWNAENHSKVTEFKASNVYVRAVDVSPDATKIATGSNDNTACVWSLPTGERLLGPWRHADTVVAAKFSPDGRLIATATYNCDSVRVYDSRNGRLLVELPVKVNSALNQSLAWASNSEQLFSLSCDGNILRVDVSTGTTLSKWPIRSSVSPICIALASDGTFIAASAGSSLSFWDTTSQMQIGPVIEDTQVIRSMAMSSNYDLVISGISKITIRRLYGILPPHYFDNTPHAREIHHTEVEKVDDSPKRGKNLEEIIHKPCTQPGEPHQARDNLMHPLQAQEEISDHKMACLEKTVQELRNKLAESQRAFSWEKDRLNETINSLRVDLRIRDESSSSRITHLEQTNQELRVQLADAQRIADDINHAHERKDQCESLYTQGRIQGAAKCLLVFANTVNEDVRVSEWITDWVTEFSHRCIMALERAGDEASDAGQQDEAAAAYSTGLLLDPTIADGIMIKWADMILRRGSALEASTAATKFMVPRFVVYRVICDILERDGRLTEAIECFRQMQNELPGDAGVQDERAKWELDFKARCLKVLEQNGDVVMESASYKDAVANYSTALSLDLSSAVLFTKRSKAQAGIGSWDDSLQDADAAIKLNPSSPLGHERKHAALLGTHRYAEAIDAHDNMLLMLEQSSDPVTRELHGNYVSPSHTKAAIRSAVERTQQDAPLVLINTETGRMCHARERMDEFEDDPKFTELVASMTTRLDHSRIQKVVEEYFRYATFSHTWEGAELLFHDVLHESVHKLAASSAALKLVMFCTTVREAGLRWAWCDTCCINKADSCVLQESLTSMFQWYHASSLTVVHLKGVRSDSELGALERSLWNTRAWTSQEFFASEVVRFYTEDWKPYLPDEGVYNHKDSSAIMAEMARASGTDAHVLLSLRPGSDNVRQKLCLAATRIAARQEDIAYSLFGIFDVSISVTYGEGKQRAVGRLLQEVLTRSGDVSILAWTGKASNYNSCLPAEISVYREPASSYVPSMIEEGEMDRLATELRTSSKYLDSAIVLYDRLVPLPPPRLISHRLTLSCIMFPLQYLSVAGGDPSQRVYHSTTFAFGDVEIKTTEDLSNQNNLVLVHPWLQCLLDPILPFEDDAELFTPVNGDSGDGGSDAPFTHARSPSSPHNVSSSHHATQLDKLTGALRLFVRLRQPFGALLLAPLSHNEYKRVASDHPIVVQLLGSVTPHHLTQKIRTLDIL